MRLYLTACLCVTALACAISAAAAFAREPLAQQALDRCLNSSPTAKLISKPSPTVPPGMSRGTGVSVEKVAGPDAALFAYQGTSLREVSCGIAIYGPVSHLLEKRLKQDIEGYQPRWTPHIPGAYSIAGSRPGQMSYWGDPKAPTLSGVLWIERAPSADAPTLEIDYHAELIS